MTQGALAWDQPTAPGPRLAPWVAEFLVTGGATFLLIPFSLWYQAAAGLEDSEYIVSFAAFYAAYVINDPHFAVSYLLFYKNLPARLWGSEFTGVQRVRYLVSGFVVPVALVAWIALALIQQSAATLGLMIQLMFFLVGWHYVKQGFGVLSVLSGRKGVRFSSLERRVVLAHCFSGWAYAWSSPREWGGTYEEAGVVYTALAHPLWLETLTLTLLIASSAALLAVVIARLRRGDAFPPLAASSGFFLSIWLWTIYSGFDPLIAYLIPGLHSLQYWYFVYLLKKNEAQSQLQRNGLGASLASRLVTFFLLSVGLAWLAFNGIPGFLDGNFVATTAKMGDDPEVSTISLGVTPYLAAFGTFINIHHYFLDHVIWRRENPDMRFLRN